MPFFARALGFFLGLLFIDQLSKFLGFYFGLAYVNREASLSLALIGLGVFGVTLFAWRWILATSRPWQALALILSGGVSNVIDRLWLGGVIDIFHINDFFFNVADILIVAGGCLLVWSAWKAWQGEVVTKPPLVT